MVNNMHDTILVTGQAIASKISTYSVILTTVISDGVVDVWVNFINGEYLKGGEWGGARLGGDHTSEASDRPGTHVVVLTAH